MTPAQFYERQHEQRVLDALDTMVDPDVEDAAVLARALSA